MKTRTQRLIDECSRAVLQVRLHTAVRILQSLGVPYPHSMLYAQLSGNVFQWGELRFRRLSGDECRKAGGFELFEVRRQLVCFCGREATRKSDLYGPACDTHAPHDEPLPGFADRAGAR